MEKKISPRSQASYRQNLTVRSLCTDFHTIKTSERSRRQSAHAGLPLRDSVVMAKRAHAFHPRGGAISKLPKKRKKTKGPVPSAASGSPFPPSVSDASAAQESSTEPDFSGLTASQALLEGLPLEDAPFEVEKNGIPADAFGRTYVDIDKKLRLRRPDRKRFQNDSNRAAAQEIEYDVKGRRVLVNPTFKKRRKLTQQIEACFVLMMSICVFILAVITAWDLFCDSRFGSELLFNLNRSRYISEDGNYIFGPFDGYVTIGDSAEYAYEILGAPDEIDREAGMLRYGSSYLLLDGDTVVGYYKSRMDEFHVTVGYQTTALYQNAVELHESASRIISKLGSPDYYLKRRWIYENTDLHFLRSDDAETDLVILFDEDYFVSAYEFVKR